MIQKTYLVVYLSWLERCVHIAEVSGSSPLTTTFMKDNFESPSLPYSEHARNWQKSAEEIAKFILDHLVDRPEFFDFIQGLEISPEKSERWQERLEELRLKATKRLGHQIEGRELFLAARQIILDQHESGELFNLPVYEKFCQLPPDQFNSRL